MHTTSHHIARTVSALLATGAVLAPVAAAQQDLRSPDTRDAAERVQRTQDLRMPDTQDAAIGRGPQSAPVVEFVDVPRQVADDFDLMDAALGAAAAIGIVLVGAGGALTTVRMRRRPVGVRS
jgi:Ni/Co efflux regulator RcnB